MPRDSTYTKREVKKRNIASAIPGGNEASKVVSDISAGFSELKRQTGTAANRIKEGYNKIKQSLRR